MSMKKITEKELGNIIRQLRISKNLSQADLARLIKVSPTTISSIERGRSYPSLGILLDIFNALNYPISILDENVTHDQNEAEKFQLSLKIISKLKTILNIVPEETLIKYLDSLIELLEAKKPQD